MKKLIVIADWAEDTLAQQEVKIAIDGFLDTNNLADISFVSSQPSTFHTAFLLLQLTNTVERYGNPQNTVFFINTDFRNHTDTGVRLSHGAKGVIALLTSGTYVIGPNSGYSFSLVKDKVQRLFYYPPLDKGSQFRSRDNYPRIISALLESQEQKFELEEIDVNYIPEIRGFRVGHIDNYGNIKTTITADDFKGKANLNQQIIIEINGIKQKAVFTDNMFGQEPNKLVIFPGSSGKPDNPFLEIAVRLDFEKTRTDKNAAAIFNYPMPGTEINLL
ncbi:MAG: hypothetical protein KatS3mg091_109 [Patescibacteria group bacterium]|nr:MAG: hypothetical protein KatS3mg091_109 [Patescibacteria group bacterium]